MSVVDLVTKKFVVSDVCMWRDMIADGWWKKISDRRAGNGQRERPDATVGRGRKLMECTVSWTLFVDGRRKPKRRTTYEQRRAATVSRRLLAACHGQQSADSIHFTQMLNL